MYDYMNSKVKNVLLIIMSDQSFVLSANSVNTTYVRVHVYCSREYDIINTFCSYKVVAYHILVCNRITITFNHL